MPAKHEFDDSDLHPDDEPGVLADEPDTDDGEDDREHRVAHRPNPLPSREEDEEELAEADILEELDLEDEDEDARRGRSA